MSNTSSDMQAEGVAASEEQRSAGGGDAAESASRGRQEQRDRRARKLREGMVTSNAMDKTAVVTVVTRKPHPRYGKTMARSKNFYAHDEENTANVGDRVRIMETRPLSKTKRWRLVEIVERAR